MSEKATKKIPTITITTRPRASSEDSTERPLKSPSLKSPRAARFAEATAVNSPIDGVKLPFSERTHHVMAQPQVSDVGFGYVNRHESVEMPDTDNNDYPAMKTTTVKAPLKSPLKSAMKTPGAPPKNLGAILSPTFQHEEDHLEISEKFTDKVQAKDLKVKTRVRMAKLMLRGVNFSCSLIVIAMLSSTFNIFLATKDLPARNSLPPWAVNQKVWPQIVLLVIASFSLFCSVLVFWGYRRGGKKRAEKAAVYYSAFAVAFFVMSIIVWAMGAGILQGSKNTSNNKDMWGWACVDNTRKQLFQSEVDYDLVCRLQNWSLVCCVIEVVVETITIGVYGIVFYRFYSKRQLRKSMANRDRARSDLYLAQLRSQSAPNTPGFAAPYSARDGGWKPPTEDYFDDAGDLEDGEYATAQHVQYLDPVKQKAQPKPFTLQPAPQKSSTPKVSQVGFSTTPSPPVPGVPTPPRALTPPEKHDDPDAGFPFHNTQQQQHYYAPPPAVAPPAEQYQEHFAAAPGEQVYDSVPIPGAYEAPLSPGAEHRHFNFGS